MNIREFLRKYLTKEDVKDLASEFDFKQSGTKNELIDRIIADPDFELDDITTALYKEDVQDICEDLGLKVTGTKDDLWDSIVNNLGFDKVKTVQVPTKSIPGEKKEKKRKRTLGIRDKQILHQRAKYKCEACEKEVKFSEMQVGHKTAYAKGGSTTLRNSVCLCYSCNKLQGTDSWQTFLRKLGKKP